MKIRTLHFVVQVLKRVVENCQSFSCGSVGKDRFWTWKINRKTEYKKKGFKVNGQRAI